MRGCPAILKVHSLIAASYWVCSTRYDALFNILRDSGAGIPSGPPQPPYVGFYSRMLKCRVDSGIGSRVSISLYSLESLFQTTFRKNVNSCVSGSHQNPGGRVCVSSSRLFVKILERNRRAIDQPRWNCRTTMRTPNFSYLLNRFSETVVDFAASMPLVLERRTCGIFVCDLSDGMDSCSRQGYILDIGVCIVVRPQ